MGSKHPRIKRKELLKAGLFVLFCKKSFYEKGAGIILFKQYWCFLHEKWQEDLIMLFRILVLGSDTVSLSLGHQYPPRLST